MKKSNIIIVGHVGIGSGILSSMAAAKAMEKQAAEVVKVVGIKELSAFDPEPLKYSASAKMFDKPVFAGENNDKKRTRKCKNRAGTNKKYHKRKKAKNGKR